MNLDQIRALAGIPMHRGGEQQIVEAKSFAPVKADGHYDITVPESAVGKVAIALAKEGLPVDVTFDGTENFFFNFKSSELKDKADAIVKVFVRESIQDLSLNSGQRKSLEYALTDLLKAEGLDPTGLEITHVQDEGDCKKAVYVYEKDGKDVTANIYFNATIGENSIVDFKEVK